MKKVISVLVAYLLFSTVGHAEVSQFVFTNEQRVVLPSTLSESLTVQSQNTTGVQESVVETVDLVFNSSSGTGEFLNSSGNPVSTTMSKNTANRTFYYRDSNTGTHTLTVTATGRDTQKSFKATQNIVVGSGGASGNGEATTSPTETIVPDDSANTGASSHSSPSPASDSKGVLSFEVGAGRARFTSIASDVVFKAEPIKLSGVPENYIQYTWTFGDGTVSHGQVVSHRYRFAGEYVVVLNAVYSDKSAVSRTTVLVIEPAFDIAFEDSGGVRVTNRSSGEVNVGEWVIEGGRTRLELPRDTIIEKGKTIIFPYPRVMTQEDKLIFKNPLGQIVSEQMTIQSPVVAEGVSVEKQVTVVSPEPVVKIVYIEKPVEKKEAILPVTQINQSIEKPVLIENPPTSDLVATVYTASPKQSTIDSFLWIPKKGWGILSGLFK